jgi:hypothetical protein
MAQAAADVCGRGAGSETDGVAGLNKLGGCESDAALFGGMALLASQKGTVITKRLIEERLDQLGSAVSAPDESSALQPSQVSTNAGSRRTGDGEQFFNGSGPCAQEKLDDLFRAVVQCVVHTAPDSILSPRQMGNRKITILRKLQ